MEAVPPLTAVAHPTEQTSPLLRLPAELQNRILQLAVPTGYRIIEISIYKKRRTPPYGQHFFSTLPCLCYNNPNALLYVCRELRSTSSALYYGNNVFLMRDDMLAPGALEAFVAGRSAVGASVPLRDIYVEHVYEVLLRHSSTTAYVVKFHVKAPASGFGVALSGVVAARQLMPYTYAFGNEYKLCCCTLRALAGVEGEGKAQEGVAVGDVGSTIPAARTVLDFLTQYRDRIQEYGDKMEELKRSRCKSRECGRCGEVKGV